jgi:hypothetical protein
MRASTPSAAAEAADVVAVAEGRAAGEGSGGADLVALGVARGEELAVGAGVGPIEPPLSPAGDAVPAVGEQLRPTVLAGQAADRLAASVRAGVAPLVAMCRAITAAARTTTVAASAR